MIKFLVPVDGSDHSLRAVRQVIRLSQDCEAPRIYLLNVREPVDSWEVRSFLNDQEIADMQQHEGEADLRAARDLLEAAGRDYEPHILAGPVAQTIADFAHSQGCDYIIIGSHGRGGLASLFLGSVATKVIHFSQVPVIVVK